jgi:uncharacterized GH25 family protein
MPKPRPTLLALALLAAPAAAHDLWLQPLRYAVPEGAPMAATFEVGHGGERSRWGTPRQRIVTLEAHGAGGAVDLRPALASPESGANPGYADLVASLPPGTHVLAMTSTHAMSTLAATPFNAYLADEGLTPISEARAKAGTDKAPGRERYSRRVKTLVRMGAAPLPDPVATRPVGHSLEIVPLSDPAALAPDRTLPLRVLWKAAPLAGATLRLTDLANDAAAASTVRTDSKGEASIRLGAGERWLLTVAWAEPLRGDPKADWDTTFASLTFATPR